MRAISSHAPDFDGSGKRTRTIAVFVGLALMLALAQHARAQQTGSHIGHNATAKDGIAAIRLLAECYYDRNPKNVVAWMNMLPGQTGEYELIQHDAINLSPCLENRQIVFDNTEVSFQPRVLRRPVGAAMARKILQRIPNPSVPAADAESWFVPLLKKLPPDSPKDLNALAIQEFGHCVAVARWGDSIALIKSADGSPEEKAAVAALIPALGGCLDSGNQIKITKRNLREMIGEPVYHLLIAAPQSEKH